MFKRMIYLGLLASTFSLSGLALADKNSEKASDIQKCKEANSDQGQSGAVIASWCECIWQAMPDSAAGSLDSWAKSNKSADEKCASSAGWK